MKSKDDKSEDGSDQERECLEKNEQTRILHVLCMFRLTTSTLRSTIRN